MFTKPLGSRLLLVCILASALLPHCSAAERDPAKLPRLAQSEIQDYKKFAAFVLEFLQKDPIAGTVLNPSNRALYATGYRPTIGVPHNPESTFGPIATAQEYVARKIYLDLMAVRPFSKKGLQDFIDLIGRESDKTLIGVGQMFKKYDIKMTGDYIDFNSEVRKIALATDKQTFMQYWLNDAVLGSELAILAWLFQQFYGEPYVTPEQR